MEKSYDPKQVESRWYQFWLERGYFTADLAGENLPYCIVMPPPNITGSLHMGHALNSTIQDILIRWRRMQGRDALWIAGTDHAGIATQNVVEKQLVQEGSSREILGRDLFVQRVWEWKAHSGNTIIEQLKRLGASCDWSRLRFTMDEGLSQAVREVFVSLYHEGLIYRGKRLINWCPRCMTALSDIEVQHEDMSGKLYHIEYPLVQDPKRRLTVATTRPETMLGDTAVAVHPEDSRYNSLIGQRVKLPLTGREIPIVADSILVDRELGTGAVKITPAHDFNDFEAGLRHNLGQISLFDQRALMDAAGMSEAQVDKALQEQLRSKAAHEARAIIVDALRLQGLLSKVEDHPMAVGTCYRCKTVVEPYLSPQWFVKIKPLAEPAIKAVETGEIRLIPEQWMNNYLAWMRDIKDWCISRQIWWGHQIPAWYCKRCNATVLDESSSMKSLFIGADAKPIVSKSAPSLCPDCGGQDFIQDPDVLDTWFSSALWPFSTLGWPDETLELKKYYPTATLVTAFDILFFWVARMIMMGIKFMGQVPFKDVYIHALVRDAEGQKMSKSKGNVIDPLTIMDMYGTDALRFTLAAMASPGRDIKITMDRIEGYRNFANKLWNAARFIQMNLDGPRETAPAAERSVIDQWILSRLNRCVAEVNSSLEAYRFDEAAHSLYHFIWHEYCDWYLELSKPALFSKEIHAGAATRATLVDTLDNILRLLHPFMPFITEEIWQSLPHSGESLTIATYPSPNETFRNDLIEQEVDILQKVISAVRDIRGAQGIAHARKLQGILQVVDPQVTKSLEAHRLLLLTLAGLTEISFGQEISPPPLAATATIVFSEGRVGQLYIGLEGLIDLDKETLRIEKRLKELAAQIGQTEKKLSNPEFVTKVPPDVLQKTRNKYYELLQEHAKLGAELTRLRSGA
jgi:valyl-tRNA synthetase